MQVSVLERRLLTASVDNADSRRVPGEVVDRCLGFTGYVWRDGLVISNESERHGTTELSKVFNV